MIVLYLAVLATAIYWVIKTLGPEMAKPYLPKIEPMVKPVALVVPVELNDADRSMEKLETLLIEKNKSIQLLQTELKVFQAQANNYDKIKSLFEEEIARLREQNRIFRSELGLPAVQLKENSIR
jgi:hypothetical protein